MKKNEYEKLTPGFYSIDWTDPDLESVLAVIGVRLPSGKPWFYVPGYYAQCSRGDWAKVAAVHRIDPGDESSDMSNVAVGDLVATYAGWITVSDIRDEGNMIRTDRNITFDVVGYENPEDPTPVAYTRPPEYLRQLIGPKPPKCLTCGKILRNPDDRYIHDRDTHEKLDPVCKECFDVLQAAQKALRGITV